MFISVMNMLLPIVVLIGLGKLCKVKNIIPQEAIGGIKNLVTTVFLPVLVFNTMANTTYGISSIILMACSAFAHVFPFFSARALGKSFGEHRNIVPYMTLCYECGMMGYTLIPALVGSENLAPVATLDLVSCFFGFGLVVNGLSLIAGKGTERGLVSSLLHTPTFVAVVVGAICGIFKVGAWILNSPLGTVYENCVGYLTAPITPVILICVGYDLSLDLEMFREAFKAFFFRIICSAIALAVTILLCRRFADLNMTLLLTLIMYFALPATFLSSVYLTEEHQTKYVACYISISIFFALIVFAALCIVKISAL